MGLRELFGFKRWEPDLDRAPPPKEDWPDHVLTLNTNEFDKFITKYPLSVVDFWAPWCAPCKMIAPRIRQLSKTYKGRVAFGKLNISQNKGLTMRYHIHGIPNLVFFSYGEKVTNITGVCSTGAIKDKIDDILDRFNK